MQAENKKGFYYSVSKAYKKQDGSWGYTNNFRLDELPTVRRVIEMMEAKEVQVYTPNQQNQQQSQTQQQSAQQNQQAPAQQAPMFNSDDDIPF